jgi:HSP20 family protein
MQVTRYDPFRELFQTSHQLNRLFGTWPKAQEEMAVTAFPTVDIYEDTEGITLTAELPGIDPKNVELKLENNILSISGERKLEREDKRDSYHRIENWYGSFNRSFSLPSNLDAEKVKAEHKNGLLRVFVPRREETKPRQLKIKIDS